MQFRIPDFPLGALLATTLCCIGLLFISPETPSMWIWETLIAISFIVWALGAGFLAERPTNDDSNRPALRQEAENAADLGSVSSNMLALIHTIRAEGRANRKEERIEDREGRIREQITIVFIGITMFAIILQVHEMVKAYEPIHDQAKAAVDQAKAAIKQASVASVEAELLKDQARAAQDAVAATGRAWGPNGATMNADPMVQQDIKIVVNYQNTGRKPAVDFVARSKMFIVTNEASSLKDGENNVAQNLGSCKQAQTIEAAQVVYPSTGFGGSQLTAIIPKTLVDKKLVDSVRLIVLTGCFAYKTFRVVHHSAFCFVYDKQANSLPNLNFCPGGSYAD